MKHLIAKDVKYRKNFATIEIKKLLLKSYICNLELSPGFRIEAQRKLNAYNNKTKVKCKNRCVFTNRGRSISRIGTQYFFRARLRYLVANARLPGIIKSSW